MSHAGIELVLECQAATGGWTRLRAAGRSMQPCIEDGDLLEVELGGAPPVFGEIALFRHGGSLQAHRVVGWHAAGAVALLTKGDACPLFDPPVPRDQVLGKVVCVRKRAGDLVIDCRGEVPANRYIAALSWAVGRGLGLTWRLERLLSPAGRTHLHALRWWISGLVSRAAISRLVRRAVRGRRRQR